MDMLYEFHNFYETLKYDEFYERSYVGECRVDCSSSQTRNKFSLSMEVW